MSCGPLHSKDFSNCDCVIAVRSSISLFRGGGAVQKVGGGGGRRLGVGMKGAAGVFNKEYPS